MKGLREELQKVREATQLAKEAAEAEKQATYMLGVEESQVRLTEELSVVCREYYGISWGKALDAAGVPVDSDLRQPENIYYDLEIRELPSLNSSHPNRHQKLPNRHQSSRWWTKVRKPRISKALVKIKARRKLLLILRRKPQMLLPPNPARLLTRWPPKRKFRILGHFCYFYLFVFAVVVVVVFFFFFGCKGMYHTFFLINESIFLLFSISSPYTLWDSLL